MKNNFIVSFLLLQGFYSIKVSGFEFDVIKTSDWQYPGRCLDISLKMKLTADTPIKVRIRSPFNNSAAILKIKEAKLKSSTCGPFTGSSKAVSTSRTNNPDINDESTLDLGQVTVPSTCSVVVGAKFQLLDYPSFVHGQSVWASIGAEYINQSIFAAQQAVRTMKIAVAQPVMHVSVSSAGSDVMDAGNPMVLEVKVTHDCSKTSAKVEKSRITIEPPKTVQYVTFQPLSGSVAVNKIVSAGTELIFETGPINFTQEVNFNLTVRLNPNAQKKGRDLEYTTFYVDVSANGSSPICTTPNKEFSQTSSLTTTSVIYQPFSTCDSSLGVASSSLFADNMFSASSYSVGNEPYKGRLNGPGVWKPCIALRKDRRQYLQVNSTSRVKIRRFSTQGKCDDFGNSTDAFVKAVKLYYSDNGAFWTPVKEGSKVKVFNANKDCKRSTIIPLPFDVEAKFFRFVPVDFENEIALKVELYGCVSSTPNPTGPTDIPNRSLIPRIQDIFVCNTGMGRKTGESSCHYSNDGSTWKAISFVVRHISHYDPSSGHLYAVGGNDGTIRFRSTADMNKAWDVVSPDEFTKTKTVVGATHAVSADHLIITDDASTLSPLAADKFSANGASITWGWSGQGVHSSTDGGSTWSTRVTWSCKDLAP